MNNINETDDNRTNTSSTTHISFSDEDRKILLSIPFIPLCDDEWEIFWSIFFSKKLDTPITPSPLSDEEWEIILSIPPSNKPNLPITNEELDEFFKE